MEPLTGRLNLDLLPRVPLPFYIRSVGQRTIRRGKNDFSLGMRNPFIEMIFSIEGQGEIIHYEKSFHLGPGEVFYYLPNEDHLRRAVSTAWNIRWLTFDGPLAEAVMLSFRFSRLQTFDMKPILEIMDNIDKNIGDDSPYAVRRMSGLVYTILTLIGENQNGQHSTQIHKRCMEVIKNSLSNPDLSITMLCETLETPRSTLCKAFRDKMGTSIGSYIKNMRLIQAMSLLRNSDLPITEIAECCGMPSLSSFSRFIHHSCGMSPQKYRYKNDEKRSDNSQELHNSLR